MATVTTQKIAVGLRLNNGTSDTGSIRVATVNLPSLSLTGYDDSLALAMVNVLSPCLSLPLIEARKTTTAALSE